MTSDSEKSSKRGSKQSSKTPHQNSSSDEESEDQAIHATTKATLEEIEQVFGIKSQFMIDSLIMDGDLMEEEITVAEVLSDVYHFGQPTNVQLMMVNIGGEEKIREYTQQILNVQVAQMYIDKRKAVSLDKDGDPVIQGNTSFKKHAFKSFYRRQIAAVKQHTQREMTSYVADHLQAAVELEKLWKAVKNGSDGGSSKGRGSSDQSSSKSSSGSKASQKNIGADKTTDKATRGSLNGDGSEHAGKNADAKAGKENGSTSLPKQVEFENANDSDSDDSVRHDGKRKTPGSLNDRRPPDRRDSKADDEDDYATKKPAKLLSRRALPSTIKLKHSYEFHNFRNSFVAHVILQQAGYLVDPAFCALYIHDADSALDQYIRPTTRTPLQITRNQLYFDVHTLYAWLMNALTDGVATYLIAEYQHSQDGIRMWDKLCRSLDDDAHRRSHLMTFQKRLQKTFVTTGTETLALFVANTQQNFAMCNTYASLESDKYSDSQQRTHLLTKLRETGDANLLSLVRSIESSNNYQTMGLVCQYLTGESVLDDTIQFQDSSHKARNPNRRLAATAHMDTFIDDTVEAYAASAHLRRDVTFIPDAEFRALDKSIARVITTLRGQVRTLQSGGDIGANGNGQQGHGGRQQGYGGGQRRQWNNNNNQAQPQGDAKMDANTIKEKVASAFAKKTGAVPMQYTNPSQEAPVSVNQAQMETGHNAGGEASTAMVEYQEENFDSCVDMVTNIVTAHQDRYLRETGLEDDMAEMDMNAYMAQVFYGDLDPIPGAKGLDIHTKFFEMHVNAVEARSLAYAISDNGAQCCILGGAGDTWVVIHVDPFRTLNIIGAVPSEMRKNGLRVVSAVSKATMADGTKVLIRAHEAAFNPKSKVTLLSEFQVRQHGCVVDAVAKTHRTSFDNDQFGTQCFQPTAECKIPFVNRAVLMTFDLEAPTEDDLLTLRPIIDITTNAPWIPQEFSTDAFPDTVPLDRATNTASTAPETPMANSPMLPEDPPAVNALLPVPSPAPTPVHASPDPPGTTFNDAQILIMAATMTLPPTPDVPPLPLAHYELPRHDTPYRFINLSIAHDDILTSIPDDYDGLPDEPGGIIQEQLLGQCPIEAYLAKLTDAELRGHTREFDSFAYVAQVSKELTSDAELPWITDDEDSTSGSEEDHTDSDNQDEMMMDEVDDPSPEVEAAAPDPELDPNGRTITPEDHEAHQRDDQIRLDGDDGMEELRNKSTRESMVELPDQAYYYRAKHNTTDPEKLRPYLGYLPLRIIKETIARTTQLAKTVLKVPMVRHLKARYRFLQQPRLRETVATDTYFANVKSFGGQYHAAQVFYGMTSHVINVHGLRSREQVGDSIKDFIRYEGAPWCFRMDNAPEQNSQALNETFRNLHIATEQTEPLNPHQNPAELKAVKWLKHHSTIVMDRRNAPPQTWFFADKYVADIHNHTADESLRYAIPYTVRHGETVDISPYLMFQYYQKILFIDPSAIYPATKERAGYWLGVCEHCGDRLTFWILVDDTVQVIARSVVRPATDKDLENLRIDFNPELDPDQVQTAPPVPVCLDGTSAMPKPRKLAQYRRGGTRKKKTKRRAKRRPQTVPPVPSQTLVDLTGDPPAPLASTTVTDPSGPSSLSAPRSSLRLHPRSDPSPTVTFADQQPLRSAPRRVPTTATGENTGSTGETPVSQESAVDSTGEPPGSRGETPPSRAYNRDTGKTGETPHTPHQHSATTSESTRRSKRIAKRSVMHTSALRTFTRLALMCTGVYSATIGGDTGVNHFTSCQPMQREIHMLANVAQAEQTLSTVSETRTLSTSMSPKELTQLQYVQDCDYHQDMMLESLGEGDMNWTAAQVHGHMKRFRNSDQEHWKVKVTWFNGQTTWERLDDMRLQDPHLLVRYAAQHKLATHPAFAWTTTYKHDSANLRQVLAAQVKSKHKFKFGVQVANSVKHALWLDKMNGNDLWREAMDKELQQINDYDTFREPTSESELESYTQIPYHIVFDVKFDLRRKARLVANGNKTNPDGEDVYSGVVAIESIRMAFAISAMNKLQVCAGDVGNAFLYSTTSERCYIIAGPEFGNLQGRPLIIHKGLYGLRTSAARFHDHLAATFRSMGFKPSLYDSDLWIRERGDHYEMLATYVDDILCFSRDPMPIMNELRDKYVLKGVGIPEYYLGGNVETLGEEWQRHGIFTALSASTYIKNSSEKIESMMDCALPNSSTPMAESYHPELDDSPLVNHEHASKFRTMIGCANWIITLGRFDVQYATAMMSRFSMAPREGHLKAMKRVFGYLKNRPNGRLLCDPTKPDHGELEPHLSDRWKECYPDATEFLPDDMLKPLGESAKMTVYVDADHAHDMVTRRSVTGIIIKINGMIVRTVSKRQKTVESSTYGSELVAARIAVDSIIELRFALRALGVPVDGPTMMLGDNKSVVLNTSIPSSVLKKKHCAINYHRIREAIASNAIVFRHVSSIDNEADILTKPVSKDIFYRLTKNTLFRDHPDLEVEKKRDVVNPRQSTVKCSKDLISPVTVTCGS